ncbi:MAG: hypothetical protein MHM6MM_005897 [Cercozoa sp. M6MM]
MLHRLVDVVFEQAPLLREHWHTVALAAGGFTTLNAALLQLLRRLPGPQKASRAVAANNIVAAVHAAIAAQGAVRALFWRTGGDGIHEDHVHGSSTFACFYLAITCGYFYYDTVWTLRSFRANRMQDWLITMHHVMGALLYTYIFAPFLQYYGVVLLSWELSTPLMYLRWFLLQYGVAKRRPSLFVSPSRAKLRYSGHTSLKAMRERRVPPTTLHNDAK